MKRRRESGMVGLLSMERTRLLLFTDWLADSFADCPCAVYLYYFVMRCKERKHCASNAALINSPSKSIFVTTGNAAPQCQHSGAALASPRRADLAEMRPGLLMSKRIGKLVQPERAV